METKPDLWELDLSSKHLYHGKRFHQLSQLVSSSYPVGLFKSPTGPHAPEPKEPLIQQCKPTESKYFTFPGTLYH